MKVRKWLARGLLAGAVLTSPLLLILAGFIWGSTNFLVLAHESDFEVVNESGETVKITPLGRSNRNPDGDRYILPQYAVEVPATPRSGKAGSDWRRARQGASSMTSQA